MPKGTGWRGSLFLVPGWRETYLLRDEFNSPLAAGSVNGTAAEPGPGIRTVTDTNSKISVSSGALVFGAGTGSSDGIWYSSLARAVGKMVLCRLVFTTKLLEFGWDVSAGINVTDSILFNTGDTLSVRLDGTVMAVGTAAASTYYLAAVMRAIGMFWFIKGGSFTSWSLLFLSATGSAAGVPGIRSDTTGSGDFYYVRVPRRLWLPVPLASDGFPTAFGTTDGTGHAETSGLGAGGGGLAWAAALGTWGISSAKANCSALDGTKNIGVAHVTTPTVDVLASVGVTRAAGAAGLVLRYTDADNFLYAYHDGTNAALVEVVAGTPANVVAPTAATYSAGADLVVMLDGASARLFYNGAAAGTNGTTNITTGAKHGLWSNNTNPTLDNFVVYARGVGGEYAYLDRFLVGE